MSRPRPRQNVEDIYRLSPVQQGMLFHSLYSPGSGVYFEQFALRYEEGFSPDLFVGAWRRAVERHPVLRTSFLWEELEEPVQVVHRSPELPVTLLDWRALPPEEQEERFQRYLEEDRRRGFDLARAPLLRLAVIRVGDQDYRVVWSYHHVVLDGWSAGLVMREVGELYRALATGAEPSLIERRPFREYIRWLRLQDLSEAREYWRRRLRGFTEPVHLAPEVADGGEDAGYELRLLELTDGETARLKDFAQGHRLTLGTVVHAAYGLLLSRYAGRDDVVFGVTVSGRPATLPGVDGIIGCFINTLPTRVRVDPDAAVLPWLERVQAEQTELRKYEHSPLVEVLASVEGSGGRELFDSILVFESFTADAAFEMTHRGVFQRTNYPLTVVTSPGRRMILRAGYELRRFSAGTVDRLLAHLRQALLEIAGRPEQSLRNLGLVTEAERRQALGEWNRTGLDFRDGRTLHALFEERARRAPDRAAVSCEGTILSYGELDRASDRLAHRLAREGVGPETLVGLCLDRSLQTVTGILGVLKAGGAYLPLDPKAPADRLRFMIEDSGASLVLTAGDAAKELPLGGVRRLDLDAEAEPIETEPAGDPGVATTPDGLAYVIYTSGSTGRPKGSLISHRNVQRLLAATEPWFSFSADDVWTLFHSYAFDFSVWELWGALAFGGRLEVVPYWVSRSPDVFLDLLASRRVTVLNQTPSAFKELVAAEEAGTESGGDLALRRVIFGGEGLEPASLDPWFARHGDREPVLVNMYGITETTVHVTYRPMAAADLEGGHASPVGQPIPDLQVHLHDRWMNLVPIGVAGEVYVGGDGLARGYLRRPALTAERFVPDPFDGGGRVGSRLYKAGDLARRLPEGGLEFLGRIDHQVKVRGFRIELGEIEAVLARHPTIARVAVIARRSQAGDQRLVAYAVARPGAEIRPDELRDHAARFLPDYMVPAAFVALAELPLTVNGKLDREALPDPREADRREPEAAVEPPATPTEEVLAGIWAEVLDVAEVGRRDDFFDLGGHSLLATRVVSRVREVLGVAVPLRALFEAPSLSAAAARIDEARRGTGEEPAPVITPARRDGPLPLSFAQERLWFLDRMEPGMWAYNVPAALRLEGRLDVRAFAGAFDALARRHESLRTVFETRAGEPVQVVLPAAGVALPVVDLCSLPAGARVAELRALGRRHVESPFDLRTGPLVRATLIRLGASEHAILLTLHHIVSDAWSLGILVRELAAVYSAAVERREPSLPALPIQYPDFAVWQRRWLTGSVLEEQLRYWRRRLAGAPAVLDLPTDRQRPAVQSYRGATLSARLPGELAVALRELARRRGATLFMVLMAGLQGLLARYSGQDDLVVGSTIANRSRAEIQGLIGFFVNTMAMRADLSGAPGFAELVARVREASLEAYDHQGLPFEKLVEELGVERDLSRSPLFQVLMQLQNVPAETLELPGLSLTPLFADSQTAKFDLIVNLTELETPEAGIHALWRYKSDLFDRTTVQRMARHLGALLSAAAEDPDRPVRDLPILSRAEARQLREWNDTAAGYARAEVPLHALVERQVDATPDSLALVDGGRSLTYRELDRRANRVARRLIREGLAPGDLAGVFAERSAELVLALLGVVKAGGAYVPLDPGYPPDRLAFMMEDARLPIVLTQAHLAEELPAVGEPSPHLVLLDDGTLEAEPAGRPPVAAGPDHPVYAIFTSGSTGRPKGVVNRHRGVVNRLLWMQATYGLDATDRVLQKTPFSFDVSVWELFWPFLVGAGLVVARPGGHGDSAYLTATVQRERVTTVHFVPSMLQVFLEDPGVGACTSLRRVIASGEALPPDLVARWSERLPVPLDNLYGPTEAAIDVTRWPCPGGGVRPATVPIGRPVANTEVHVVDRELRPPPVGVAGELLIGGVQVAAGYLRRPGLTAERFVPDPFAGPADGGARLYRTGDLVRRRRDGAIDYLGRLDQQVKLRGFRIELGEIEAALAARPDVREAVVTLRPELAGGPALVAYVVLAVSDGSTGRESTGEGLGERLAASLAEELPEHMVPSAFVVLDALPLSPNGKVDRKALPAPAVTPEGESERLEPRDELERYLAGLFREVLGSAGPVVGVHDDFFSLGGNSIAGAILINRLQEKLGAIVHVVTLFDRPTVAGLARYLAEEHPAAVRRLWGADSVTASAGAEGAVLEVDESRIREFRALLPRRREGPAPRRRNPPALFILSPPRSGSTLLRVMLGGHPHLFAPPELELLGFATLAERREAFAGPDAFRLEGLVRAVMEVEACGPEEAEAWVAELEAAGASTGETYRRLQERLGGRLLVDKTPTYAWDPAALHAAEELFEEPRYVHLVRHPYGMVHSFEEARVDEIFFRGEHPFSRRELAELSWVAAEENIRGFLRAVPAERRHLVLFEDLVRRPEATLEELCGFLELPYEPAMAEPYRDPSGRMTDGIHPESRMLGDVKFHRHDSVDADVAERWREAYRTEFLGARALELAAAYGYRGMGAARTPAPLEAVPWAPGEAHPLSFAQERLWFLDQLDPGTNTYNVPVAVRLVGHLDLPSLATALEDVARRQASLRTTFAVSEEGRPVQVVTPPAPLPLPVVDLSGLPEPLRRRVAAGLAAGEARHPFDLARGPLVRVLLVRLGAREHAAHLTMHHVVSDGWSMGLLVRETAAAYRARTEGREPALSPVPIQYVDFAVWQRRTTSEESLARQVGYWRDRLAGVPVLQLPTDRPRPRMQTFRGATRAFRFPRELAGALHRVGQDAGTTSYVTLLAAYQALLGRWSGQEDLSVGSPFAGRHRAELENLIGFFVNTLVLRGDLAGDPRFDHLLARVRDTVREAFAHQDVPFERVVQEVAVERSLSVPPLFQAMLAHQDAPTMAPLELPGLELDPVEAPTAVSKFDLSLTLVGSQGELAGQWVYNVDLFDAATAERIGRSFETLLVALAEDPTRRISELPLLAGAEREEVLVEWNRPALDYPTGGTAHGLVEAQAAATPDAVAVVFGDARWSHGELDRRARSLAAGLRALGVGAESRVGLAVERSPEMVVALLAILRSGGAYVPLDPGLPRERLSLLAADAGLSLVVTQERLLATGLGERLGAGGTVRLEAVERLAAAEAERAGGRAVPAGPEAAAYVIYTSGSTGRPKGVVVGHGALANRVQYARAADVGPEDALLQRTTVSFDVSVLEILSPLASGGRTVLPLPGAEKDPRALVDLIARERITLASFPPTLLHALLEDEGFRGLDSLSTVVTGGETVPPDLAQRVHRHLDAELLNRYGPTETTVSVTSWICRRGVAERSLPIGYPTAKARILVLDRHLRPLPPGVVGEIFIGGPGLARGYLQRPGSTAQAFVPDPHSGGEAGARLYRTGDLARHRRDGAIEFVGRMDQQIKIRGFRVELGEIEAVLAGHPAVGEVVVVDRGEGGDKMLAAYAVAAEGASVVPADLQAVSAATLPAYMVPASFTILEQLPLTPSGKVDRASLPAPDVAKAADGPSFEAPRGLVEETLAALWRDLLGVAEPGRHDDFFDLGGHSLLATRVVARVRRALGVDLPLRTVFEAPTIAGLARSVEELLRRASGVPTPPLVPVERDRELPLSFAQERLWFLAQLEGDQPVYNVPLAARLVGRLDRGALRRSVAAIVRRHEALRTTFRDAGGHPVQEVHLSLPPAWLDLDLTALPRELADRLTPRLARRFARMPFDLAAGPLLRVGLVRLGEDDHVVLLTLHHIVADVWSMGVFLGELGAFYRTATGGDSAEPAPLPVQYADYAAWQREWLQGERLAGEVSHWRERLAGAPRVLELPTDRPRPAHQTFRGRRQAVRVSGETAGRLSDIGRERGATLFMIALATTGAWLGRLAGQEDLLLGTPVANRDRAEVEGLIGFFLNTLVMRADLSGDPSFAVLVERARGTALDAFAHQETPFEKLVEELAPDRDLSRSPLFQVSLVVQSRAGGALDLPGVDVRRIDTDPGVAKLDLTLSFLEAGGELLLALEHNTDLFDSTTAGRLLRQLRTLLDGASAAPEVPLSRLALLSPAERQQLREWNEPAADYAREAAPLHGMVARQAERTPDAVAVVFEQGRLSHGELDRRARELAEGLRALGVGPESRVGVTLERSPEMVVTLLAIFRSGGAYVPLDPGLPGERLAFMASDAGLSLVVTQERLLAAGLRERLGTAGHARLETVEGLVAAARGGAGGETVRLDPEGAAYVLYTSGSTGRPKGVVVSHGSLANRMQFTRAADTSPDDAFLQKASASFDVSVLEIFGPLLVGGRTVLPPPGTEKDPRALTDLIARERITQVALPPALLHALLEDEAFRRLDSLTRVSLGGEAASPDLAERFHRHLDAELLNRYGPTETTIAVTSWACRRGVDERSLPVGRPIAGARIHVLDRQLRPVSPGLVGEIFVGGPGVARGYLGRPALTAAAFVPDPDVTGGEGGARLYRTGDLARHRPDGAIGFVGRMDQQIKVRGFRVELGEVEAVLAGDPAVREVAVLLRRDLPGGPGLVAYVVPAGPAGEGAAPEDLGARLAAALSEELPAYMVPSAFVILESLPLNPHGKVDRQALPAPELDRSRAGAEYASPRSPEEELLANLWAGVLGVERVGRHDDFFDLGGHSLLATRLLARIRDSFGVAPPLRALFEGPTVAQVAVALAAAKRSGEGAAAPPLEAHGHAGTAPLSFSQERLWFLDRLEPGTATYNMPTTLRLEGVLDLGLLAASLERIAGRHESLRTTFGVEAGRPLQRIAAVARVPVGLVELGRLPPERRRAEAVTLAARAARRPFDLARGPLLRATLLRVSEHEHLAVLAMHHIVSDGASMRVLLGELTNLYRAGRLGEEPVLPPLPVQYADYALWQRRWLRGEVLERQVEHWRRVLDGAPELLTLPTDRPRPAVQRYRGRRRIRFLPGDLVADLQAFARSSGATLFMVLLAALETLISRHSGQEDVVVGTPVAGRTHRELEALIGFFLNSIVLRVQVEGETPFRELVARAREASLEAFAHQDLPFERLVEELGVARDLSRAPLFQILLVLQGRDPSAERLEMPDLTIEPLQLEGTTAKFDLTLNASETPGGLACRWMYNSDLFDGTTVERFAGQLETFLRAAVSEPDRAVGDLALLSPAERQQVREWNDTATPYDGAGATLHGLVARQADATPDAVALIDGGRILTYRELDRRASRIAHRLAREGLAPGGLVGVFAERSAELVLALLGVLNAGGAYVPLDPGYPAERLAVLMADARLPIVLVQDRARQRWAESSPAAASEPRIVLIEDAAVAAEPARGRAPLGGGRNPAYAIFTSGSTGRPKGVVNSHRGVVNRLLWMQATYGLNAGDRVLQKTPFGFDVSVWELFWPLLAGAAQVVARPGGHQDSAYLVSVVRRERVTTLHFVPSMLQVFLEDPGVGECTSLSRLIASGEALPPDLVARCGERLAAPLDNLYGPTEAAIDVTRWPCPGGGARPATVPIGRPVANTAVQVVDRRLRPVAGGAPGELVLGGVQVATGYLGRPALTAERFIPDPFAVEAGVRLYRTGDLARRRGDGAIEYLGRLDHQVKLRGFRIELGEIEACLAARPEVREAVVVLRSDLPGGPALVAYVVPDGEAPSAADLREHLGRSLPEYMVPAAFVFFDALPLSPNGKVDRKALPAPDAGPSEVGRAAVPRTELERYLAGLFREVLGARPSEIGIHDDFFSLGGNSIAGAVLVNRLQEELGEIVHVVALFDRPTVGGLAGYLAEEYPAAVRRLWGGGSVAAAGSGSARLRIDEERIQELRALIAPRRAQVAPRRKNPSAVFVLSPPRSGSTLLRVMLGGHAGLFAPPELELLGFGSMAERREAFAGRDAFRLEGLVRAIMELEACGPEEGEAWVAELEAAEASTAEAYRRLQERLDGRLLVDKTPTYAWDPETLRAAEELFEEPRYVHLVRHPYGMIESFEEAHLDEIFFHGDHPFSRRELAELLWVVSHRNVLELFRRVPATRRTTVRFEDLVRDPEATLRGLCDFLDLEYHPAMAEPYGAPEGRMTDGVHPESRMLGDVKFHRHRRVDPAVADRWREQVGEDFLGDVTWELASRLGYDAADRRGGAWLPLEPADRRPGDPAPLSFAQERLWFLDQLSPGGTAYNIPAAFRLRGALDERALERALVGVVERHESLRTRFAASDGEPLQIPESAAGFHLDHFDLSALEAGRERELERLIGGLSNRPFDLARGGLFRAALVRLADDEHALVLVLHHAVADGWSVGVLFREVTALYGSAVSGDPAELPELPIQYADYSVWQRAWLGGERLDRELAFWRRELDGAAALDLPTDRPRPAVQTYRGAARPVAVTGEAAAAVGRLAREWGATPFMFLAAAFAALLHRYSGQADLTLGTPVANRTRAQTERLIGFFANTLVLRVDLQGRPGYRELVGRVRRRALGLYAHQEVPFEKVVEELQPERDLSRSPLFQVMFALQNARGEVGELPGLKVERLRPWIEATKFELSLSVGEGPSGVVGAMAYNRDLFDPTTVDRMVAHLTALLSEVAAAPDRPLAELPLLSPAERSQLVVEWNDTAVRPPSARTVPELFARAAEASPDAVAVEAAGRVLSYGALAAEAERLARELTELGVDAGSRVALCLERSPDLLVAALAVMTSGAAYVPLDPDHPAERLAYVLEDSGAAALVSQREVLSRLGDEIRRPDATVLLDLPRGDRPGIAGLPAGPPSARPDPLAPAYVIYTSGSTGRPKGVVVPHDALANFLLSMGRRPGLGPDDVLCAVTTLAFDIAGLELYLPLLSGARVVVASREETTDGARLAELLDRSGATVLQGTPATWHLLLDSGWRGDGRLKALCGGEALPRALARRLLPRVGGLWNLYGPTETTIWSAALEVGVEAGPVPVGGPIGATALHAVDGGLEPVPIGVPGELAIGGAGLAHGYHRRPAQTAERFVPDPLGGGAGAARGARLYRTGDLVRRRPDGRLEFVGRIDHQVKVRGFRIELGEVETVLAGHPNVERVVAAVHGRTESDRRLVAYVIPRGGQLDFGALRRHASRRLPEYMVPTLFVPMEELPLTPNGKVDRRALPEPGDVHRGGSAERLPPRTEVERRVAAIWEEVLGVESVGARDDFFALGGHSLLLVRLNRRLRQELGREVPVVDLFRHSTVEALAALLARAGGEGGEELPAGVVQLRRGRPGPSPLFLVHPLSGELTLYRSLVDGLPAERAVFGFQAHGLEEGSVPDRQVEEMADRYACDLEAVHPEGPVLLAGSSMGGLVAFEMARRLTGRGRDVALVALVDTPEPDPLRRRERRTGEMELALLGHLVAGDPGIELDELGAMNRDERLAYVLRRGHEAGTLPAAFGLEELRRLVGVVAANQVAMESYRPECWDGRLLYVRATEGSASGEVGPDRPWSGLALGGIEILEARGTHLTIHLPPQVKDLAARLGERLERADRGGGAAEVSAAGVPGE